MPLDEAEKAERHRRYVDAPYSNHGGIPRELRDLIDYLNTLSEPDVHALLTKEAQYVDTRERGWNLVKRLLYALPRRDPTQQYLILTVLQQIALRHAPSRQQVAENSQDIEDLACRPHAKIQRISQQILQQIGSEVPAIVPPTYVFREKEVYAFYAQFRSLISRANSTIFLVDNYASDEFLDYVHVAGKTASLSAIRILTKPANGQKQAEKLLDGLNLAKSKFLHQYPSIGVEIRTSSNVHDRFLVLDDNSVWKLGPSLKDGGKRVASIEQKQDADAEHTIAILETTWTASTPL